jgi:hypothetical protein
LPVFSDFRYKAARFSGGDMQKQSSKTAPIHPIQHARTHYAAIKNDRRRLDLRYEVYRWPHIGHRLLGHKHPNGHTKKALIAHFGRFDADGWIDARQRLAWLHGRVCIPHPACPEAFDFCRWITYADAVAITGRSAHTFARWRWDDRTVPDEAVWRLLEWAVHACCAWPPRVPGGPDLLT